MRCFLVTGPESAGNRLLAALLARAGCVGEGSTDSRFDTDLPDGDDPAVVIRSVPHGGVFQDIGLIIDRLMDRGYEVTVLVTVRHPVALAGSQVERGHAPDLESAHRQIEDAYARIFHALYDRSPWHVVPYESLVLEPEAAVASLLDLLDLPARTSGAIEIDRRREVGIRNENTKHFAVTV